MSYQGDSSYHQEALRKARVLQRKNEAQKRLQNDKESCKQHAVYDPEPTRKEGEKDAESLQKLHFAIYKDLKDREKVLRNNNICMGPMAAFAELYPTSQDRVNFKPSKFH